MKINLDLLHKNWYNNTNERGSGRTTRMLIEALQQADFGEDTVFIVAFSKTYALNLEKIFLDLAKEMEYIIKWAKEGECLIEDTLYKFISRERLRFIKEYRSYQIFEDHYKESQIKWDSYINYYDQMGPKNVDLFKKYYLGEWLDE